MRSVTVDIDVDDVLDDISTEDIVEYLKENRNMSVKGLFEFDSDQEMLQALANYVMRNKQCHSFLTGKEDFKERVCEMIEDNYYLINRRL